MKHIYKGKVGTLSEYKNLHRWLRTNKKYPEDSCCEKCKRKFDKLEICSKDGKYNWDTDDYFYGCRSCNCSVSNAQGRFLKILKELAKHNKEVGYQRRYWNNNKEKIKEYVKNNQKKVDRYQQEYRDKPENIEKRNRYNEKYYKENRELILEQKRLSKLKERRKEI